MSESNDAVFDRLYRQRDKLVAALTAERATLFADALIAALNKEPQS